MARVSEEAVEFAKKNVEFFYDSDFFPKPFEYKALSANWSETVDYLTSRDIKDFPIIRPRSFAAPKPDGGFRVAHQLDPLNHLLYTSIVYELSLHIEANRVPIDEHVACSYRVQPDMKNGSLFASGNGYEDFIIKCSELAHKNDHVLVTDITDFYNQIYLHRLRNVISYCDDSLEELAADLEHFLMELNDRVSKGVPVGPPASIVLAEALLIDIDNYIISRNIKHTRYVDDFRIFSDSKSELQMLLQDLTVYLYETHRLNLSSSKTEIISSADFLSKYLQSPEEVEKTAFHKRIKDLAKADFYGMIPSDSDSSAKEDKSKARNEAFADMINQVCMKDKLDLGLARHILRKCRKYRIRSIIPTLFANFDFFAPVVNDVVLYLDRVVSGNYASQNQSMFIELLAKSETKHYDFVRFWLEYFFAQKYAHFSDYQIRSFVLNGNHISNQAIAAIRKRALHWVRDQRGRLDQMGRWDRRQVLQCSVIMPIDERIHWLERVERSTDDFLERMVIRWCKSI